MICDLAEAYGVYDYRRLPPRVVAVLVAGLRDNARIKQKITGVDVTLTDQLLAIVADRLGALMNAYGGKVDFSIYDRLMGNEKHNGGSDVVAFDTVEEFRKARYGG